MKTAKFKKNGGPIVAEIKCGYAQPGSYTLLLWEAKGKKVVKEEKGDFINPDDDSYELPLPNEQHDGRLLDCLTTLKITPPIMNYMVALEVSQDGRTLEVDTAAGKSDQDTVVVELFVKLEAEKVENL